MSIQGVRGFNDIIDENSIQIWQKVESILKSYAERYGYHEIKLPYLEHSELFQRGIGETSDIVNKEMYTFSDKNGQSITLRPEGTASCVRAAIEHNVLYEKSRKWYYLSPMFRRERPQKGRFRQFYQFGIEAIGIDEPYVDTEHLAMIDKILKALGVREKTQLHINYLNKEQSRQAYKEALRQYYNAHADLFDEVNKKRLDENPLRILDSKDADIIRINQDAPNIADYRSKEEQETLSKIMRILKEKGIDFVLNSKLVRGLDYYGGLIYEWIGDDLGAQSTVCGGGRYDGLTEVLGGKQANATGFSIGIERLLLLLDGSTTAEKKIKITWLHESSTDLENSLTKIETIRNRCPTIIIENNFHTGRLKNLLKKANKSDSQYIIIRCSSDETHKKPYILKDMLSHQQTNVDLEDIISQFNTGETNAKMD